MGNKSDINIKEAKEKINNMVVEFNKYHVNTKTDKYDNETKVANPMAIKAYFFGIIENDFTSIPIYTPEQLNTLFILFTYIIEQINLNIVPFAADIKDFCKLANLTNEELIKYKDSNDVRIQSIIERLYDYCRDSNLILAQNKIFSASVTSLKAKSELEIYEKKTPNMNINISVEKKSLEEINDRLKAIRNFETKALSDKNE